MSSIDALPPFIQCYHHGYKDFDVNPKTHESFETICTTCKVHDYTHYTIIFNAFIFAQVPKLVNPYPF